MECEHQRAMAMLDATKSARKAENKTEKVRKRRKAKKKAVAAVKRAIGREISEKEKAQVELYKRELSKRHLLAFIKRYEPEYLAGWMHKVLCDELMKFSEAVERGESPRLMITMPPRHGKSMAASQYFPAWHLGRNPSHEFINFS